jgi:hypothetical protein
VPDDPYTDPVTEVLRNKLGLDTAEELAAAEREITHAALILIRESPVRPTYDLAHLCAIHRRIFDRDRTLDRLQEALAVGRIDLEEFSAADRPNSAGRGQGRSASGDLLTSAVTRPALLAGRLGGQWAGGRGRA